MPYTVTSAASEPPALFLAVSVSMPQGTVDINRADAAELDTLPGIGPKLAQAIIEDREQYGPFYYPEDLIHVKGIGAKTLAKLWEQLKLP